MNQLYIEAAKWWADRIDGHVHHDNGATDHGNILAQMLADAGNVVMSKAAVQAFSDVLAEKIEQEIEHNHPYKLKSMILECDYSPCRMLLDTARETGIPIANFPWKTDMIIDTDHRIITVSEGYGAPWTQIYHQEVDWDGTPK